jgi:DNA end-binding protein Ku
MIGTLRRIAMLRPIWKGSISFGLVNIPVRLFSAKKPSEQIHFHLMDKKTHTRVHYKRVNEKGTEVAWEDIEKAYEFEKGKYVVINTKMLEKAAAENYETVAITNFVDFDQIDPFLFETPYYLLPDENGIKGYTLLQDILTRTKKVGIAEVVIRTKQHIAVIIPIQKSLGMILLSYPQEIRNIEEFDEENLLNSTKFKVSAKELALAEQLVKNMTGKWQPKKLHDETKEILHKLIKQQIKAGKTITEKAKKSSKKHVEPFDKSGDKSGKVYDFMDLLKKSVAEKEKRKPKKKV